MRTRRRGRIHAGLAAGLVTAVLFGCTAPSPFDVPDDAQNGDAAAGDAPSDDAPGAGPDARDDPDPDGPGADNSDAPDADGPDPQAAVCNDAVVAAAGATIESQLDALGEADFESALRFASRRFQAEVDPANFEAIITAQYPVLLDDAEAEFGRCAQVDDLARLEVMVTGTDGARDALVYLLVREEGRWSIDGAASVEEAPSELV